MNPLNVDDILGVIIDKLDSKTFHSCSLVHKQMNRITNKLTAKKRKQFLKSVVEYIHDDGFMRSYSVLPNGKMEGRECYMTYEMGKLESHIINWVNGKKHGKHLIYSSNDSIDREYDYENDKIHGSIKYYVSDKLYAEYKYINGKFIESVKYD